MTIGGQKLSSLFTGFFLDLSDKLRPSFFERGQVLSERRWLKGALKRCYPRSVVIG
jgi:hypothetical protein